MTPSPRALAPAHTETRHTLQRMLLPEPGLNTEGSLYARVKGGAGFILDGDESRVWLDRGALVQFNTAFNAFNLGKWREHCGLRDLSVRFVGDGTVGVTVFQAMKGRSWERIVDTVVNLTADGASLDLNTAMDWPRGTMLHVEMTARSAANLTDVIWETTQAPVRSPRLGLSVTTFRREIEVTETIERFASYLPTSPIKDDLHLFVVDNGQSLDANALVAANPGVTILGNENLGGSGGFTRGLIEVTRAGFTHCQFMDDDAAIHMQALERTHAFLSYATDPNTAVAGALIEAAHRWRMWENGATFDERCQPIAGGTDLREVSKVYDMEFNTVPGQTPHFYGGWWHFAFPVEAVETMPFPFFVRGDDVSFSLINNFNTVTLPGVVSFQDADFSDKESAQTLYLDLRSHLVHHLVVPSLDKGRRGTSRIAWDFFKRSMAQMHYDTLASLDLAVRDVMDGPSKFAEMADMAQRRADIKALADVEQWSETSDVPTAGTSVLGRLLPRGLVTFLMGLTLYGLMIPLWSKFGDTVSGEPGMRGNFRGALGASKIVYVRDDGTVMVLRASRRLAFKRLLAFAKTMRAFNRNFEAIRNEWRTGYFSYANLDWWEARLGLAPVTEEKAAA